MIPIMHSGASKRVIFYAQLVLPSKIKTNLVTRFDKLKSYQKMLALAGGPAMLWSAKALPGNL